MCFEKKRRSDSSESREKFLKIFFRYLPTSILFCPKISLYLNYECANILSLGDEISGKEAQKIPCSDTDAVSAAGTLPVRPDGAGGGVDKTAERGDAERRDEHVDGDRKRGQL